ncbi:hypothetical protein RSgd_2563 [Ralstonia solanacearum]
MSQRISSLVALDGADEGLKRAIASAERSLGELAASAKTAGDRATVGLAQVNVGVSVIGEQITTARTQLLAFLSINWTAGKVQEIVQVADAYFVKNDRGNVVLMAEKLGSTTGRWRVSSAATARPRASNASSVARTSRLRCWCRVSCSRSGSTSTSWWRGAFRA